jgi:hypothetical protein
MLVATTSRADLYTAFGAVATAVFTGGIIVMTLIAHLHDRALSGAKGSVIIQEGRRSLP